METVSEQIYPLSDLSEAFVNDLVYMKKFREILKRPNEATVSIKVPVKGAKKLLDPTPQKSQPHATRPKGSLSEHELRILMKGRWGKYNEDQNEQYVAKEISEMKKTLRNNLILPERIQRGSPMIDRFKSVLPSTSKAADQFPGKLKLPLIGKQKAKFEVKRTLSTTRKTPYGPYNLHHRTGSKLLLAKARSEHEDSAIENVHYGKFILLYMKQLERQLHEKFSQILDNTKNLAKIQIKTEEIRHFYWTTDLAHYGFATKETIAKYAKDWENHHQLYQLV